MKGVYRVYEDGQLIAEFPNIITNRGRIAIGRFLAGQNTSWSDVIVAGVGESSPDISDNFLDMEIWRDEIDFSSYVSSDGTIILRSTFPTGFAAKIYELGIYCTSTPQTLSRGPVIATFDSSRETWSTGTRVTDQFRVGSQGLKIEPAGGGTASSVQRYIGNFRAFDENTVFKLGYFATAGVTQASIRLKADNSNYREHFFVPNTNGSYSIEKWSVDQFTVFGNPDWQEIYEIEVRVTGSGHVVFDGFSAVLENPQDIMTVLVSRALVQNGGDNFIKKEASRELQIEYIIDLGINL